MTGDNTAEDTIRALKKELDDAKAKLKVAEDNADECYGEMIEAISGTHPVQRSSYLRGLKRAAEYVEHAIRTNIGIHNALNSIDAEIDRVEKLSKP